MSDPGTPQPQRAQRVFLSGDERLTGLDPKEARAREIFGRSLIASQQSGHSQPLTSKAWSPRHSAIRTKLPLATPNPARLGELSRRLARSGGRLTAQLGPRTARPAAPPASLKR